MASVEISGLVVLPTRNLEDYASRENAVTRVSGSVLVKTLSSFPVVFLKSLMSYVNLVRSVPVGMESVRRLMYVFLELNNTLIIVLFLIIICVYD